MAYIDPFPQIVILDISLEKENGLEFIPEIKMLSKKRKAPAPGIVICSMHEDLFLIRQAMELGAAACCAAVFVAKSAGTAEILTAIDAILAGNTYVNPKYQIHKQCHAFASFTPREKEIIALLKQSLTNQQIAERLKINLRTLESHLAHAYSKAGVTSREALIKL
jgi:DNA-binding NarL/FixJ family response regulator